MFRNFRCIGKSVRFLSTVGTLLGLAAMPLVASAENDSMTMPMNSPTAAGNRQPMAAPQAPGQGMGMGMMGMGPGMKGQNPGMQGIGQGNGQGKTGMGQGAGNGQGKTGMGQGTGNGQSMPDTAGTMAGNEPYHIGSKDFFLDQADKLKLTPKQTTELTEIKRKALEKANELQEKVARLESELFTLTSGKSPNEKAIATKVKQIEAVGGERRLGFIKSVGKAEDVLDKNQRKILGSF